MNNKKKLIITFVIFFVLILSVITEGVYIFINKKTNSSTEKEKIIKDSFPIDLEKNKIETPEEEVYTAYSEQSKNRIVVRIEDYYELKDYNDEELTEGSYGVKVILQQNNKKDITIFESNDPLGARVGNIEFSPNGRFVSFDVSFYEGFTCYLFDLDSLINLNKDRTLNIQSIKWADDSSYAIIENSYSEYMGDGQDGIFKLDAVTKKIEKIK